MIGGDVLGQYEYDEEKRYYVQASTEQIKEEYIARFLYKDEADQWMVGPTPGEKTSWLSSSIPSKELPTKGWKYFDVKSQTWQDDLSLTATPGPLPPLPAQVTVTASGAAAETWPTYLGVFNMTERWWSGRPVYVNTHGRFLFHTFHWMIGNQIGYYVLTGSSMSHQSPVCERSWKYFTGIMEQGPDEKPASVKILSGGEDYGPLQAHKQMFLDLMEDCKTQEDYLMKYLTLAQDHKTSDNDNDNSNLGWTIAGPSLSILGLLIGAMSCAYKSSKKNEVSPQVDNSSERPPPHHRSLHPAGTGQTAVPRREGCIVRIGPPTPYSVSQSWNTGRAQQTAS